MDHRVSAVTTQCCHCRYLKMQKQTGMTKCWKTDLHDLADWDINLLFKKGLMKMFPFKDHTLLPLQK